MHFKTALLATFLFTASALISHAQTIQMMSYNIRYDNPGDGPNNWHQRKAEMVKLINYYAPDAFGIQEGLHHQVKYLDSALMNYTYTGVGRDDGKTRGEYAAIFYNEEKLKMEQSGTFWLSENSEEVSVGWDASMERICTYALFTEKQSGHQFWIFNAHYDHRGNVARIESSKLILKKIAEFNIQGHPVVLTGDFNSTPDMEAITTIEASLKSCFESSQKPAYGPQGTFNDFRNNANLTEQLDYIFVKGLRVISARHIDDRRTDYNNFVSDHLPVLSTLKF